MELKIEKQARGTRIITGDEARNRRELLNGLISIAYKYGFEEIILPSIEPTDIYIDKAGEEILNQMYVFKDRKDRDLCLRPEGTATVQAIADKFWNGRKDVKVWYFDKFWRYERPQRGRYREFFQFGIEVINPRDENIKEELIAMAEEMVTLKCEDFTVAEEVKRGLDYYVEDGFEISVERLGAQKQICGGGRYKQGIGFAIGFDRLMLC
jgi:histidyl-tRNA synthetase